MLFSYFNYALLDIQWESLSSCTLYTALGSRLFIVNQPNSRRCSAVSSDLFNCGREHAFK